jgi:hypothetical protein
LRLAFLIGAAGAAIVVVGSSIHMTMLRLSPVVNGDQWKWIDTLQSWLENGFSWSSLFAGDEHNYALFRVTLFADYLADHSTNRLLIAINLLEYIGTVAAFAALQRWAGRDHCDWIDRVAYVAFVSIVLFSAANLVNLAFGYQAAFIFGHAAIVFAVLMAALAIEAFKRGKRRRGAFWLAAAAMVACAATFAQGNAIFIWPLILIMSWIGGVPMRYLAAFAAISAAALVAFFSRFHLLVEMGNTDPRKTWTMLHTYSEYMPQYLGNIIVDALRINFATYALGWIGLICSGIAGVILLRNPKRWTAAQLALLAILTFVVITAWLAALSRQGWVGGLVADRYRLSVGTFWAAALGLILSVPWRSPIDRAVRLAIGALMSLIILAVVLNQKSALERSLIEGQGWNLAANALRMGIADNDIFSAIIWFPPPAPRSIQFLRARQLSVFADGRRRWIGQPLDKVFRLDSGARCSGNADRPDPLKSGDKAWHIAGQAWDEADGAPAQLIVVDDATGMISGIASAVPTAWDIRLLLGKNGGNPRAWEGLTRGAPNSRQTVYGIRRDGITVCAVTRVSLPD